MVPAVILWSIMAAAVIGLALYRKLVATHEDDLIHLSPGEESLISQQSRTAGTLDAVDRWGKMLTIAVSVYGFVLLAIYIYGVWVDSQKIQ